MAGFVLNLIINGIPSILGYNGKAATLILESFKPYYKWNTFNTELAEKGYQVVELSGFKPYYKWNTFNTLELYNRKRDIFVSFKPYYKWNTFNTE